MPTHITRKIKTIDLSYAQYALFLLAILSIAFLFTYAYLVNATVRSVVHREHMENSITSLHSEVSELEARYLAHIEDIDMELAEEKGFTELSRIHYAQRVSSGREVAQAGQ